MLSLVVADLPLNVKSLHYAEPWRTLEHVVVLSALSSRTTRHRPALFGGRGESWGGYSAVKQVEKSKWVKLGRSSDDARKCISKVCVVSGRACEIDLSTGSLLWEVKVV